MNDTDTNDAATIAKPMAEANAKSVFTTELISKATLGDDELLLWYTPKQYAVGDKVFTDILTFDVEPASHSRIA